MYVLSFLKKRGHYSRGDFIQGRKLFKEIQYMKPLFRAAPGVLIIQIPIHAECNSA